MSAVKSTVATGAEFARANALYSLLERRGGSLTWDAKFFAARRKIAGFTPSMCWQAGEMLEADGRARFEADGPNVVLRLVTPEASK